MRTLVPPPVVVTPCPAFEYVDLVAYLVRPPVARTTRRNAYGSALGEAQLEFVKG